MIAAVVFDFDGVLVDSEAAVLQAWRDLYAARDVELPLDAWLSTIGTRDAAWDPARHLEERLGATLDWPRLEVELREAQARLVSALPLLPGVESWLADATRLGLRVAMASSSSLRWVGGHLRERGLLERFEVLVTREDAERSKPDPEPYLVALRKLGVAADRALAIEDSANGVASAKAAGLRVVAVPHGLTAHMDFRDADLRVGSLAEVTLEEALAKLGRQAV